MPFLFCSLYFFRKGIFMNEVFNRVDEHFIVTVNNLRALEAVSQYVYNMLETTYFIEIEVFDTHTLYNICILVRQDFDEKIKKTLERWMSRNNINLLDVKQHNLNKLNIPIEELGMTIRSTNCLLRNGIHTVGDLCDTTESRLAHIKNFGRKSMKEVKDKLKELGLELKYGTKSYF